MFTLISIIVLVYALRITAYLTKQKGLNDEKI